MVMDYYAHKSEAENEDLIDHLRLTADLAERNGSAFNHAIVCKQMGLLHDIGKHTENFQKVLNHSLIKQDHAIVAGLVYNTYGSEYNHNKFLREAMSLAMACHHSYLYSDSYNFVSKDFKEQVYLDFSNEVNVATRDDNKTITVKDLDEYDNIKAYIKSNDLLMSIPDSEPFDISKMSENEKMFYVRMLYSCLVDADYSATSVFCDNKDISDFENKAIDAELCSAQLQAYYDDLIARSDINLPVNKLRKQVYDACSKKGSELSGFVTLTAPTGTGKTLSLMKFALEQAKRFKKDRIFVVLPFLSIINQNAEIYKNIFGSDVVLVDDSQVELTEIMQREADRWSAKIIVTTSVKFFETLFASKATSLRRLHNIANSVVIFDECQTLPSDILNSTIEILQSLTKYYDTTVLFSTATKPEYKYRDCEIKKDRGMIRKISVNISSMKWQASEIIDDVQGIFDEYDKIKNTEVICDIEEKYYTCNDLIDYYSDENQVLYIFNTVKHAIAMYDALCNRYDKSECYIITSNFCAADKLKIIEDINNRLHENKPVRLASTQCVEAGVDFDFKAGAREYGPFESIIQSAGRVNRNGRTHGRFLVFTYENHGEYDYPSSSYRHASNISLNLADKHNGLSFYDLSQMDEYYKKLYQSEAYKSDLTELYDGEFENNYKKVSDNYKLIKDNNQAMIIVKPLYDDSSEFDMLISDVIAHDYTVNKKLMRKLSNYTVSAYCSKKFDPNTIGTQLSFRNKAGKAIADAKLNWFLINNDDNYKDYGLSKDVASGVFC